MSKFIISGFADEIDPSLDIQMETLKSLGLSYIEVRGVDGNNISKYDKAGFKAIKERLDANGMKISSIGSPVGKIKIWDDFSGDLESFKNMVEAATIFGAEYIRMFSFYMPEGENPETYSDEVMERWSKYIEVSEGSGIILCHENEKGIYGDNAERCLEIMTKLNNPRVRTVFDPANFVQVKQDTKEAFEMLRPYIEYVHIKDALLKDGSVVPAGMGDGNVAYILKELEKSGYEGFLSLEPHLGNFVGLDQLEESEDSNQTKMVGNSGPAKYLLAYNSLKAIIEKL